MKFGDKLRFVRQNMKKNKTRLFMTVLATAMGCAFLIVLASVGFGLQQSIVDNIVGDRLVTAVNIHGKETEGNQPDHMINDEDIAYFREVANVKAVTYKNFIRQHLKPVVGDIEAGGGGAVQVDFEAETKAGFELYAGRMPQSEHEVIVGYHIRENEQFLRAEAAGKKPEEVALPDAKEWLNETMRLEVSYLENGEMRAEPVDVTIVGVAKAPSREWNKDNRVYIGKDLLEKIETLTKTQFGALPPAELAADEAALEALPKLTDKREYNEVQVIAERMNDVKAIAEQLRQKGYYNHSIANELEQVNMMFLIMKIGLIFVGTIAVLIASIGIFNTMTMAVTERAQDIGIMKAIGAHPSTIRKIFLLESSLIGLLGALIGTIVSYGISVVVNAGLPLLITSLMNERVPDDFRFSVIPPYLAAIACIISLFVALLSGSRPAKRATRVDVLRALRRDL
ncbi:ABC transporter permease [Paenibacillus tarimensis]